MFDIELDKIQWIANGIAIYLKEIYSGDRKMSELLDKFFKDYPICAFSKLKDRSVIYSLNHNQYEYAEDGYRFYKFIQENVLNTIEINRKFNLEYLTTVLYDEKKDYDYPARVFRKLLFERYAK